MQIFIAQPASPGLSRPMDLFLFCSSLLLLLLMLLYLLARFFPRFRRPYARCVFWLLKPLNGYINLLQRLERRRRAPRWPIGGSCKRCGQCCRCIAVRIPLVFRVLPVCRHTVVWYYVHNYGFRFQGCEDGCWLIFSCSNLGDDNLCRIYPKRARLCRDYPDPYQRERPHIAEDCGYSLLPGAGKKESC